MSDKKKHTGLAVFLAVIGIAVLFAAFSSIQAIKNFASEKIEENTDSEVFSTNINKGKKHGKNAKQPKEYIARLYITGVISEGNNTYNQQWLIDTIDELEADENNRGIILYINSPGGTVYESDEAYLRLLAYKEHKPLYAYFAQLAASGGYYIGCAADYIMANRNSITGSIGVISGQFTDLTELMEKYGIKSETIHAGKNKNMGNYNEPTTDEQRAIMQAMADECYDQFTDIVATARGLSKQQVVNLADGRIYTAKQAQDKKLIDAIGSWDEMVSTMQQSEFDEAEYEVIDYSYKPQDSLYRYLLGFSRLRGVSSLLPGAVEEALTPKTKFPAYYYEGAR